MPEPRSKGGRASRQKGDRKERQIVKAHHDIGVPAERVPLSGAAGGSFAGDIDVYVYGDRRAQLVSEVKSRKNGEGFKTLTRWMGENDILFLVEDRHDPLVVLPWRVWAELLGAIKR